MNRQLQTTMNPNARPQFPSSSQMLRPRPQYQSFYNTQIFPPRPSPPVNPPPFKRQRILQTPTDHKTLCQIKKVERQTIKSMDPCSAHQTGLIEIPYQILRCVQAQGLQLNRTSETVEYLSEQVTSLREMVQTALGVLRSSRQSSKETTPETPHPLLPTYLTLVNKTLESLKTNPPSSNTLQSTSESISKLNQLIQLQCNFDSLGGSPKESSNEPLNGLALLSLALPTTTTPTPTLESLRKTLQKMEQNLKTFMNLRGYSKKEVQAKMSRSNGESCREETPPLQQRSRFAAPTTSTPIKTNSHNRNCSTLKRSKPQKRKDKRDEDVEFHDGIGASFGNLSVIPHTTNTREILHPTKSFSFSYVRNSMDVD